MKLFRYVAALLVAGSGIQAQTVNLTEAKLIDSSYHIVLTMEMANGKIIINQAGQQKQFDRGASARHEYLERVLEEKAGMASGSVRHYREASANIVDGKQQIHIGLDKSKTLHVAQRFKDNVLVYNPKEPMTREEMEVTEHFDSLAVPGLAPGKEVKVGEKWQVAKSATQALCYLDGLVSGEIAATLDSVVGDLARVKLLGNVVGIDKGSQVKLLVEGHYLFDSKKSRIVELVWKQSDQREQGPVSPAMSADVTIVLKRTPIAIPEELDNNRLRGALTQAITDLVAREGKLQFHYGRDWHVVSQREGLVVLRLLDSGDFVAQCSITTLSGIDPAKLSLQQFETAMSNSLGWEQTGVINAPVTEKSKAGYVVHRVSAQGKLSGNPAVQSFYLVVDDAGNHRVVTFSMSPNHVSKIGNRDAALVDSIRFLPSKIVGN